MKQYFRYSGILCGFYLVQFSLFYWFLVDTTTLLPENFLNWDAEHYSYIAFEGYDRVRTAFFPLFPWLWSFVGWNSIAISVANGIILIFSFAALATLYSPKYHQILIVAATPTFIFFFLPYSESLFFLGSVILLVGYRKNMFYIVIIGLLVTALARPTASIFIPAVIITEWLCRKDNRSAILKSLISVIAIVAGMIAALYFQYLQTGNFWSFFEVQSEVWNNRLRIPELPLTSWAGLWTTALDGTALFVSLMSGFVLFKWWKSQNFVLRFIQDKGLVFSLLYLFGIGLLILLIRGGELFSLNRFVYSTAFFIVAAFYYLKNKFNSKHLYYAVVMLLYWLIFNSYVHIQTFLKYFVVTLFSSLPILMLIQNKTLARTSMVLFFIGLVLLQVIFFFLHLNGQWIA